MREFHREREKDKEERSYRLELDKCNQAVKLLKKRENKHELEMKMG